MNEVKEGFALQVKKNNLATAINETSVELAEYIIDKIIKEWDYILGMVKNFVDEDQWELPTDDLSEHIFENDDYFGVNRYLIESKNTANTLRGLLHSINADDCMPDTPERIDQLDATGCLDS